MTSPTTGTEAWAWRQLASPPVVPHAGALVPWALTVVPVAAQFSRLGIPIGATLLLAAVVLVGAAVLRAAPTVLPAVVVTVFGVVASSNSHQARFSLAFVAAIALPVWSIVVGSARLDRRRFPERRNFTVAGVPLAVGSVLLIVAIGTRWPVLGALAAAGLTGLVVLAGTRLDAVADRVEAGIASGPIARVSGVVDRAAIVFGRTLGVVVMLIPAGLIQLMWLVQRAIRFDPLAAPVRPGTHWVDRPVGAPFPERLYTAAAVVDPRGGGRRLHQLLAGLLTVAVLTVPPVVYAREKGYGYSVQYGFSVNGGRPADEQPLLEDQDCTEVPSGGDNDPVMGRDEGWPRVACEVGVFATNGQFDATTTYRFPDYSGKWLNVEDGERRTWRPPECSCQRITVWWFGGSAAWGYWQRDDFSLPSQVAKAAWERGIALDIHNYAMPGWVLGQEARRFAQLAASSEDPPDLVMFYDGGNELNRQKDRNGEGRGSDESETSFAEVELDDVLHNGPFPFGQDHVERDSSWPARDPELPYGTVAHHAVKRYSRDVDLAKLVAASVDATPVFMWQPLLPSASANAGDENVMTPEDRDAWHAMLPVARDELPAGVIDLSTSLDDVDRLVFKDVWHTNELGADVVARAIDRRLADTYDAALRRG